ncbi:aminotransferase class V-fold PLP-dependent enzyme [Oscillatoria salina]|uniref:aminotransferase class V-fold PLP-dependent enzyme n=1 Tax=Oscillatoria salina TaxID=331517 RepID=UPI001CC91D2D|nr:aminotransferase class V-fold PLP-dependent enzyme [Oscillatoria salina]MBZ8178840.1 aminotransferase class V-fold PLP-dependent enzyme [Oscillatoria salina IIICB1]
MTSAYSTMLNLEQYRQQFPALAHKAYFNFGGQGTMPQAALSAIYQAYEHIQTHGPFAFKINSWLQEETAYTRATIASELGAPPETITLTENVTVGCNIALWGIIWQPGDRILLTDCEHPGVIAAVREIARRFQVQVSTCPIMATLNHGDPVAAIAEHLHANTRLVVLSHLLWNTGQVLPLAKIVELCHNHRPKPVKILVDAAQSAGSLPLKLSELKADFYAFTGHKWLCGPAGVGGLYVRPEVREELHPTFIGWRSITTQKGKPKDWKPDGSRYEVATSAYPQYLGLRAAIATHQKWGTSQERYRQICQNSEYLWQLLQEIESVNCLRTSPPEAGLVSFQLSNISQQKFVKSLEDRGFLLRTLADPDCIRACVHYFTSTEEIDQLVTAIQELLEGN